MIKAAALTFFLMIAGLCSFAQNGMPSYPDVLREFFSRYTPSTDDQEDYTNFAKKKDGWHVQQINRYLGDKVLSEALFYSAKDHKYMAVKGYKKAYSQNFSNLLPNYLNRDGSTMDWYSYERIPYFGYNEWHEDVIRDFGGRDSLTDTLYDGLGRAYSMIASHALWAQSGGYYTGNDSLQQKLARYQRPSAEKLRPVKAILDKELSIFEKLAAANPNYKTIIGNGRLKVFDEYMHLYATMLLCGDTAAAAGYMARAPIEKEYLAHGKNYLNSCEPNAILFTYGDNDTYQLWYLQNMLGFRKDVSVINKSMLGLPVYIDVLRGPGVQLSVPAKFLADDGGDAAYRNSKKHLSEERTLSELLNDIYAKTDSFPSRNADGKKMSYPYYPDSSVSLTLSKKGKKASAISFDVSNYIYGDALLMLDIINTNVARRPIYFTSSEPLFEGHLLASGIDYKLTADNTSDSLILLKEEKDIEKYILEKYIPVQSDDSSHILSADGDASYANLYGKVLGFYAAKDDKAKLKEWCQRFYDGWKQPDASINLNLLSFGFYFIEAGYPNKGKEILESVVDRLYERHLLKGALAGYVSQEYCESKISSLKEYLSSKNIRSKKIDSILEKLEAEAE